MIYIHGWPGLALCWKPQLLHFASLGYYCVAMDTYGYGRSPAPHDISAYSCQKLVPDQLALLKHLDASSAIWVAHDWGCGPLWTLAAHHPELCRAVISLCIPYRAPELGLEELLKHVNRDIYDLVEFPHGQFEYQAFYQSDNAEQAVKILGTDTDKWVKLCFAKGDPQGYMKPMSTSIASIGESGVASLPDIPLEYTTIEEPLYDALRESLTRNGWWPSMAYYLNDQANREYNREDRIKNNGVLDMPVLYIDAKCDHVCSSEQTPSFSKSMRRLCRNYQEGSVEAGHWVNLEKLVEVNRLMKAFLEEKGMLPSGVAGVL